MGATFEVEFTVKALDDLLSIRDHIAADKPIAAKRWVAGIIRRAKTLSTFPLRHEAIPEAPEIGREYRHFIQGKYRVIYRVAGRRVFVIRVIHTARLIDTETLS